MKKIVKLKRLSFLLLFPIGLILTIIASNHTSFAQWYSTSVYPYISLTFNFLSSLVPISIAEILVILLIVGFLLYLVLYIRKIIIHKDNRKMNLIKMILNPICLACVIYFIYTLSCGINYYRYTFAQTTNLSVKASPKSELIALCEELAEKVNRYHEGVRTDSTGTMKPNFENIYQTATEARNSYQKLSDEYPSLTAGYGQPKPVILSKLMSYGNITGIFIPFTFEANINADIPNYSIPSTMCHELTHLRGFMREDEANFLAYLACEKSSSADFRYSGAMLAFVYANNALFSVDQKVGNEIFSKLCDGAKRDFAANNLYWKQFEGPVAEVSQKINDSYLKANKQDDGVKSYGRMVDLLLADFRKEQNNK